MANEDDPTPWPLADMIAVARRTLVEHGSWGSKRPPHPPGAPKGPVNAPPNLGGEDDARIYPFTKGIEISNEGIGYGEETKVSVINSQGKRIPQRRRRTRTGSIVLSPAPAPLPLEQLSSKSSAISPPPPARGPASPPSSPSPQAYQPPAPPQAPVHSVAQRPAEAKTKKKT